MPEQLPLSLPFGQDFLNLPGLPRKVVRPPADIALGEDPVPAGPQTEGNGMHLVNVVDVANGQDMDGSAVGVGKQETLDCASAVELLIQRGGSHCDSSEVAGEEQIEVGGEWWPEGHRLI